MPRVRGSRLPDIPSLYEASMPAVVQVPSDRTSMRGYESIPMPMQSTARTAMGVMDPFLIGLGFSAPSDLGRPRKMNPNSLA